MEEFPQDEIVSENGLVKPNYQSDKHLKEMYLELELRHSLDEATMPELVVGRCIHACLPVRHTFCT